MLSSFNWQACGRERRVSVVCCVLNPRNIRQFCAWAMADLPAVISPQCEYTVWDFQRLAAGLLHLQKSVGSYSPEGKGGGADVHKEAQRPAGARFSHASCELERLFIPVHSSTADLRGVWNTAFSRLCKYRAWWFGFERFCFHGLMYSQSFTKWNAQVNPKHLFREITLCLFQSQYSRIIWCEWGCPPGRRKDLWDHPLNYWGVSKCQKVNYI